MPVQADSPATGSTQTIRPGQLVIRPALTAEAHAVAELAAATFPLACPPDMPNADQQTFIAGHLTAAHFAEHLRTPGHLVLVAEHEGALIGYTLTLIGEPLDQDLGAVPGTAYLSKCYLIPAAQGTGVAGRLMTATLDAARASGAPAVVLGVNGQNARAQAFYRRHGFEVAGERTFTVGARTERDLVLTRTL
ncbi:GNAT family N-acetyltransferase [Cellulomonas sp. NPDC089187]|uniref:GNAT family N-acetyltransferase n=1 Tax=Cellulomonas sp. NPDC089187 TaxID=3154970 RepID=UPI003422422F